MRCLALFMWLIVNMTVDRRANYVMKGFLVPIIVSVVIGAGAVVLTFKYNEGGTVEWRRNIEAQIASMKVIMQAVQANQIELASNRSWQAHVDDDLNDLEDRMSDVERTRFTKADADVTTRMLEREIELLWEKVDSEG